MTSNPFKVVCDSSTIAKSLKISVVGRDVELYLKEVKVMGNYADGEYGYLLNKFCRKKNC